jgi:inosine/xanthosine triphosphatase
MIVNIGSKNKVKINALKETVKDYNFLKKAKIKPADADSGVYKQPKTLKETINGAVNRAKNAFLGCDLSVGIEDGLFKVPRSKSGYMNITACAIFDGKTVHLGLSSAFEYPKKVTKLVFNEGLDITQAFNKAGLSDNPKLGSAGGAVGILTKGRHKRIDYTKQAITNALIHLDNKGLY